MKTDTRLFINNQELEFTKEPELLYNYVVTDTTNPTIVKNSFSKSITVNGTARNNDIFGNIWKIDRTQSLDNFNPAVKAPFTIYVNGEIYEKGYCKLDKITEQSHSIEYQITLYGGLGEFLYNLSYLNDDNDSKQTLSDLLFKNEAGETMDLDFVINKNTLWDAWNTILENPNAVYTEAEADRPNNYLYDEKWRLINFAPCYNGIADNFDNEKVLINNNGLPSGLFQTAKDGYSTVNGYSLGEQNTELTEWETLDLRSYNQRPVINIKRLLEAIMDPDNNGGYEVKLDSHFFNTENPYYTKTWVTLPLLTDLELTPTSNETTSTATITRKDNSKDLYTIDTDASFKDRDSVTVNFALDFIPDLDAQSLEDEIAVASDEFEIEEDIDTQDDSNNEDEISVATLEEGQQLNEIWYTSTDGNIVTPYNSSAFGSSLNANTYESGQGIITFGADLEMIGYRAFRDCTTLKSITLPQSVTTIGNEAFRGTGLQELTLTDAMTQANTSLCWECTSLVKVTLPANIAKIYEYAFYGCSSLKTIISLSPSMTVTSSSLPDTAGTIYVKPEYVSNYSNFEALGWKVASLTEIRYTTSDNTALAFSYGDPFDVEVLSNEYSDGIGVLTTLGSPTIVNDNAFRSTKLKSIVLPETIVSIGTMAFRSTRMASIALPDSLTTIKDSAFCESNYLTSILIPANVSSIGVNPFWGCSKLTSISVSEANKNYKSKNNCILTASGTVLIGGCSTSTIPDGVITISNSAFRAIPIASVTFPDSVRALEAYAFYSTSITTLNTNKITSLNGSFALSTSYLRGKIYLPNVETIAQSAMQSNINVTSIVFGSTLKSLENYALNGCSKLSKMTVSAMTAPSVTSSSFRSLPTDGTLYVPQGSDYSSWLSVLPSGWTIKYFLNAEELYTRSYYQNNNTYFDTNAAVVVMLIAYDTKGNVVSKSDAYCLSSYPNYPNTLTSKISSRFNNDSPKADKITYVKGKFVRNNEQYTFADWNGNPMGIKLSLNDKVTFSRLELKIRVPDGTYYERNGKTKKNSKSANSENTCLWITNKKTDWNSYERYELSELYNMMGRISGTFNFSIDSISLYSQTPTGENFKSNSRIAKTDLLSTENSPADYLLSYCKLFGLYFYKNPDEESSNEKYPNGVIHIMDRDTFYTDEYVDIEKNIDRSRKMEITIPITNSKWYSFYTEQIDSVVSEDYKAQYGNDYGRKVINTNYNFNSDTSELYDGNVFKGGVMVREKSRYFVEPVQDVPLYPFGGMTYSLFKKSDDGYDSLEIEQETQTMPDFPMNGDSYLDAFAKLQCHSDENSPEDGDNVLLFLNDAAPFRPAFKYHITDDVVEMDTLNEGNPCHILTASDFNEGGERIAYTVESFPNFTRDLVYGGQKGYVTHSLDFGSPSVRYCPDVYNTKGMTLYERYWQDYIADLYDVNTRKVSCYVLLKNRPAPNCLRPFYWFDNSYWILNKIKDWNMTKNESTLMEFIKVNDPADYSLGRTTSDGSYEIWLDSTEVNSPAVCLDGYVRVQDGGTWSMMDLISVTDEDGNTTEYPASDYVTPTSGEGAETQFSLCLPENTSSSKLVWKISLTDQGGSVSLTQNPTHSVWFEFRDNESSLIQDLWIATAAHTQDIYVYITLTKGGEVVAEKTYSIREGQTEVKTDWTEQWFDDVYNKNDPYRFNSASVTVGCFLDKTKSQAFVEKMDELGNDSYSVLFQS